MCSVQCSATRVSSSSGSFQRNGCSEIRGKVDGKFVDGKSLSSTGLSFWQILWLGKCCCEKFFPWKSFSLTTMDLIEAIEIHTGISRKVWEILREIFVEISIEIRFLMGKKIDDFWSGMMKFYGVIRVWRFQPGI